MAEKEKLVRLQDGDRTLTFTIRRMSASQMEHWIYRAMLALADSPHKGLEALLAQGRFTAMLQGLDFDKITPLLDGLMSCCSLVTRTAEKPCTQETLDRFVQEAATLMRLRLEALTLNLSPPEEEMDCLRDRFGLYTSFY